MPNRLYSFYRIFPSPFTLGVLITYSIFLRHLNCPLYHAKLNIFFTFPDDAVERISSSRA